MDALVNAAKVWNNFFCLFNNLVRTKSNTTRCIILRS